MQKEWKDDKDLFKQVKEHLNTAVVGDIMDEMGYIHQFLPPTIQPLRDDIFVVGRAMTVLEADVVEDINGVRHNGQNPLLNRSFGLMIEAFDDLKEDEVYICIEALDGHDATDAAAIAELYLVGANGKDLSRLNWNIV